MVGESALILINSRPTAFQLNDVIPLLKLFIVCFLTDLCFFYSKEGASILNDDTTVQNLQPVNDPVTVYEDKAL